MRKSKPPLVKVYEALFEAFGPQHWWPGRTRFEVMVGAILTQNTSWTNVEKAIQRLRREKALSPRVIHRTPERTLAAWLKPAGYFNVKARRLKALVACVMDDYGGSLSRMGADDALRERLLQVKGVGPETADSIILYAFKHPVFVVDAYTRRILVRHGWIVPGAGYEEMANLFTSGLPREAGLFNEFHALIVATGKAFCRPSPRCDACPLKRLLPRGGPRPLLRPGKSLLNT